MERKSLRSSGMFKKSLHLGSYSTNYCGVRLGSAWGLKWMIGTQLVLGTDKRRSRDSKVFQLLAISLLSGNACVFVCFFGFFKWTITQAITCTSAKHWLSELASVSTAADLTLIVSLHCLLMILLNDLQFTRWPQMLTPLDITGLARFQEWLLTVSHRLMTLSLIKISTRTS